MGLEAMRDLAINEILPKLGRNDIGRVSCVSKLFREYASEDSLWSKICLDELDLVSPQDPQGNRARSFKAAYQLWREAFAMYPWPLVLRVNRCWGKLKSWLSENYPEAETRLRGGASESDIEELESLLKVKLPLPTRVLYRFHDGQELVDKPLPGNLLLLLGIIGGYHFYNHFVNVYLLPLRQVIDETKEVRHHLRFSSRSKYIVVAASLTSCEKLFFLNCTNGQLYVGTRKLSTTGEMIQCVPSLPTRSVHDSSGDQHQDAVLLWLEEHGHRLESGIINVREQVHEQERIRSISLFPEVPPSCYIKVTNGVKICASAVFVPELANLQDDRDKYLFAYSIRMSLLPEGCIINGMTFNSCQLNWRKLYIHSNNAVASYVSGPLVIRQDPLLFPGMEEFIHENFTHLRSSWGSIEGHFTFVPGRLADPEGDPFEVPVANFPLQKPDYVF